MPKSLVVVESPAKAKTINKFLGRDYTVCSSVGHIRDLPAKKLGVDVENGFSPEYITIRGKGDVIKKIQAEAKKTDAIYLAADPDREGEAICWHIAETLKSTKKPIYRVTYNEITESAIHTAMENPSEIDQRLVDSQQARRVLDRLVGYQISPILWRNVRRGLSAGRVQSVAVRLICEREAEIEAFDPQEYWTITANLSGKNPPPLAAKLLQIGEEKGAISTYGFPIDEARAAAIVEDARTKPFIVKDIKKQERKRRPVPPFITSTLQQEAARKLRFTAKRAMAVAQQLYEGLNIGTEGAVGLITYMRTDSTRVAEEALEEARGYITKAYGADYLPKNAVRYRGKGGAQDAHEAIRPTSVERTPQALKPYLSPEQHRLYDLIWKRFVASQMNPAILDVTTINISAEEYLFRATGSILKFDGFMRLYLEGRDDGAAESNRDDETDAILPILEIGERLDLHSLTPKQHYTQPPSRYTEATLVKALEEKGIGRPSTYASIISTIQDREYVLKEERSFQPTDVGRLVNQLLIKGFPDILDTQFTAKMEDQLDEIAEGKSDWVGVLSAFYEPFNHALEAAPAVMSEVRKDMEEESDEVCDKCNSKMVVKWGRYGRFLGCSSFPECRNIKRINGDDTSPTSEEEPTDETCEKCDSPMVIKTSRAGGKFLACTGYPECKNAKPINIGVDCPEADCEGYIGERRSKRGKVFYGCSNYPKCDFVAWDKPVNKECPECDAPFLIEKTTKTKGRYLACNDKTCGYAESAGD